VEVKKEVFEKRQKILGPEHPSAFESTGSLARLLWRGNFIEGEQLQRQALEVSERVRGPDNPRALNITHDLAVALRRQEQCEEALILFQRAYEGSQDTLGMDHPNSQVLEKMNPQ